MRFHLQGAALDGPIAFRPALAATGARESARSPRAPLRVALSLRDRSVSLPGQAAGGRVWVLVLCWRSYCPGRQSNSIWALPAKAGKASRIACDMHCQPKVTGGLRHSSHALAWPTKDAAPIAENRAPQGQDAAKLEAHARREETEVPPPSPKTGPRRDKAGSPRRTRRDRIAAPVAENRAP